MFLTLTGVLLIMDLDQPKRFVYVLLRPQWKSWLVRGGYSISVYGLLLTLFAVAHFFSLNMLAEIVLWIGTATAILVAVYTAFLFAQAKGRDFWQSPTLALHMLIHSFMAGAAFFSITNMFYGSSIEWEQLLKTVLYISIGINLFIMLIELTINHPTDDAKRVSHEIVGGRYKKRFWIGSVLVGNLLPLILLFIGGEALAAAAGLLIIIGIYLTEKIWIEAPQRIQLT